MRTLGTWFVAAAFGLTVGCGGGSGGSSGGRSGNNGGQCPASSGGKTCTGDENAYDKCVLSACSAQYAACFGNNYAKNDFTGSVCADWMGCEMKCPCGTADQLTCESSCATQFLLTVAGQTCLSCVTTLNTCVQAATTCTKPVCTTPGGDAGTTPTATGCSAAQACCTKLGASLGAQVATQCQTALTGLTDAQCTQAMAGYQTYCQ